MVAVIVRVLRRGGRSLFLFCRGSITRGRAPPGSILAAGVDRFTLLHSFAPHLHPDLHHTKPGSAPCSSIWWRYSGISVMFAPQWISQAPGAGPPAPAGRLSVSGVNGVNDYSDQYLSLSIYLLWNNPHRPCRHLCLHFSRNSGANLVQRCNHDCGRVSDPAPFRKR